MQEMISFKHENEHFLITLNKSPRPILRKEEEKAYQPEIFQNIRRVLDKHQGFGHRQTTNTR